MNVLKKQTNKCDDCAKSYFLKAIQLKKNVSVLLNANIQGNSFCQNSTKK